MNAANLPIAFRKFAFHPFVRPEMPTPKTPEEEMQEEFDQVPEHVGEAKTRPTHVPIVPYVVSLANNHAMDFGRTAFETETLPAMDTLPGKAFFAGVGMNFEEAAKAVSVTISDKKTTIHVVALTTQCAGTPKYWNANSKRSGMVCLPPMITMEAVEEAFSITCRVFEMNGLKMDHHHTSNDNIIVLSIHWGPNWAYRYRDDLDYQRYRQLYAQRVIDKLGVDVLYGHSSHHIRGMELYKKKLIIYGAGDLVNDYEGFSNRGDEIYNKFGGLFVVDMDANDGHLVNLAIIPTYMYKLQLKRVQENSHRWDPQKEEVTLVMNGATGLCQDINKLSTMDVGDHGEPLTLRTIPEHPEIPGGPVLVYP
jgi:poly-gamma-glutamate capsule biosynthesis protein CapA/YwtB (metallophosphatase superfamily)